ncbi:hypothetical protein [Gluconobacter morbifer]|uniref:Uncharacterized protein n=1 Tax=Gluconobacter morbifer G707 TaxID=1088869 RepID=G6XIY7_9PROT|nr:hypothetical protein [Gluconobacter morbifer]EHH68417.1 hypothetical protein GMO_11870 [Gluconobacter morbifer G707]
MNLFHQDEENDRQEVDSEAHELIQEVISHLEKALRNLPENNPAYQDIAAAADTADALQSVLRG